jgi:uncharacterized DUF497 family protein
MRHFDWDESKAESNLRKHGVAFEEAVTVFNDPLAGLITDESHSEAELRHIAIGHSWRGQLLLVSFVERRGVTRIISCRRATAAERRVYEQGV